MKVRRYHIVLFYELKLENEMGGDMFKFAALTHIADYLWMVHDSHKRWESSCSTVSNSQLSSGIVAIEQ